MQQVLRVRRAAPADEADLVERARAGDRAAFDGLVRQHFERVYGLLFRLVGNHEDAEDLAQQGFVRAWRSLAWYRGDAAFSTWLFRIAVHLARDHQRAAGRRPSAQALGDEAAQPAARPGRGPDDELAGRELAAALRATIDRLPHRLRAALVLRVREGMEYDEVARICGVTPGTARVHVMKARRELLRRLGPDLARGAR